MKISYNWLHKYLDFNLSPERVSEILTDTGLEIEGINKFEEIQGGLQGLVIGEVLSSEPHPDADRLKVTQVNIGTETLQIVCGAPNVKKGLKVIVATVGTTLYPKPNESFKIKKSKIRGVESAGMICAEDEIGLGDAHEGIMVLPDNAETGLAASAYFDIYEDVQLEIGLTPNRCDAMGHIGVARDLKAYLNYHNDLSLDIQLPETKLNLKSKKDIDLVKIDITDQELCPKYIGAILHNVKVGPSPKWLQNYLKVIGLEPINNVVDVSNYVMYEFGTPMHAFDRSQIKEKVSIRKATKGNSFKTLDGIERTLNGEELMIASGDKDLCIAGVFGGADSGINDKTTAVFLESAIFNPTSVRKTSKAHGIQTDASFRFERGVDVTFTEHAMHRAILLLQDIAGASIAMHPIKSESEAAPKQHISFSLEYLNDRLGTSLELTDVKNILESLDFELTKDSGNDIQVSVPEYRIDVTRPADILEEVLRIYGFNKVELPKKWHISFPTQNGKNTEDLQRSTAEWLVSNGFNEVMNNSLRRKDIPDNTEISVQLLNPLSKELETMRRSLFFGLLENIAYNQNRQQQTQRLFEFGKSYYTSDKGFTETRELGIVLTGKSHDNSWQHATESLDFFNLKQYCQNLTTKLGVKSKIQEGINKDSFFERSYQYTVGKETLIEFGQASKKWCTKNGIKTKVFIAIANWDRLLKYSSSKTVFKELPKTFYVKRDFSLILNQDVEYASIEKIGYSADKKLLKEIALFDVYEGDKLPEGKKSYAVSFTFQDHETTLKDKMIDPIMESIRMKLEKELGAELRA